jgi:hypothetical protein
MVALGWRSPPRSGWTATMSSCAGDNVRPPPENATPSRSGNVPTTHQTNRPWPGPRNGTKWHHHRHCWPQNLSRIFSMASTPRNRGTGHGPRFMQLRLQSWDKREELFQFECVDALRHVTGCHGRGVQDWADGLTVLTDCTDWTDCTLLLLVLYLKSWLVSLDLTSPMTPHFHCFRSVHQRMKLHPALVSTNIPNERFCREAGSRTIPSLAQPRETPRKPMARVPIVPLRDDPIQINVLLRSLPRRWEKAHNNAYGTAGTGTTLYLVSGSTVRLTRWKGGKHSHHVLSSSK